MPGWNRAFSHDVTAAMLVFQNKGMVAVMVNQTNPLVFELYFYAILSFVSVKTLHNSNHNKQLVEFRK